MVCKYVFSAHFFVHGEVNPHATDQIVAKWNISPFPGRSTPLMVCKYVFTAHFFVHVEVNAPSQQQTLSARCIFPLTWRSTRKGRG